MWETQSLQFFHDLDKIPGLTGSKMLKGTFLDCDKTAGGATVSSPGSEEELLNNYWP